MIRQLEPNDSVEYFKLRLEGLQMHPEAFGTGAEDWSKATDSEVKNLLKKSNPDDFVIGYFKGEKLAGVVGLKREKKHSVDHKGTVWGLFVSPEFRKQSIAKSLIGELVSRAAQNKNLLYLRAVVTVSPINAITVFTNCGFSAYGTEKHGIKEGSRFFDQCFMAHNIRK